MADVYGLTEQAARKLADDDRRLRQMPFGSEGPPDNLQSDNDPFLTRFQNVASISIPGFGVGFAGLMDATGGRFSRLSVRVINNSATNSTGMFINGPRAVEAGGYGWGYLDYGPVLALCDNTYSFTTGSIWGPSAAAADWKLHKGFDGFRLLSTAYQLNGSDKLVPVQPCRGLVRRFQLTENWGYYTDPKTGPYVLTGKLLDGTPVSSGGTLMDPEMTIRCNFSDEGDTFGSTGCGRTPNALSGDTVLVVCDVAGEWRCVSSWIWDDPIGTMKMLNTSYAGTPRGWGLVDGSANSTANKGSNLNLQSAVLLGGSGPSAKSNPLFSSTFTSSDHNNVLTDAFGGGVTLTHTISGSKTDATGLTGGAWTTTLNMGYYATVGLYERLNNGVLKT